jgi:hypothetical protein
MNPIGLFAVSSAAAEVATKTIRLFNILANPPFDFLFEELQPNP